MRVSKQISDRSPQSLLALSDLGKIVIEIVRILFLPVIVPSIVILILFLAFRRGLMICNGEPGSPEASAAERESMAAP